MRTLLLLVGLTTAVSLSAQRRSYSYWSLGAFVGASHYQGDLDDNGFEPWAKLRNDANVAGNPFRLFRPSFGVAANFHFHPHMFVGFGFNYGWLGASDDRTREEGSSEFRAVRGLDFKNRLFEVSAILTYEFLATDRHYRFRPKWSPYIFAGVALFHHNPYTQLRLDDAYRIDPSVTLPGSTADPADYESEIKPALELAATNNPAIAGRINTFIDYYENERNIFLQPLRTEGQGSGQPDTEDQYSRLQFAIPLGIGARVKLTDKLDLRINIGIRKTFTDHLDDLGNNYYADPNGYYNGTYQTENRDLSFLLSDRTNEVYRATSLDGVNSGGTLLPITPAQAANSSTVFEIQSGYDQPINDDGGFEVRGWEGQSDWYAFTQVGITYIIDPGDRCPKFK